jgi:hypothetical protein
VIGPGGSRERSRGALRRAIAAERRRAVHVRRLLRAGVAGTVVFVVFSMVPGAMPADVVPLLTMAETAQAETTSAPAPGEYWYSRTEEIRLVEVPPHLVPDGRDEFRFLLPTVHETWFSESEPVRRSATVGEPRFLAAGDEQAFRDGGLASVYLDGGVATTRVRFPDAATPVPRAVEEAVDEGRQALLDALRAQVPEESSVRGAEMLRLTAGLVHRFAADPGRRSTVLRAMADLPGIEVAEGEGTVDVSIDFVDGDRPLRLSYRFDVTSARLVAETLVVLAGRLEVTSILSRATFEQGPASVARGS